MYLLQVACFIYLLAEIVANLEKYNTKQKFSIINHVKIIHPVPKNLSVIWAVIAKRLFHEFV